MKKRIISFSIYFLLLAAIQAFATAPKTISWQGMITDAQGNPLDGNFNIVTKLFGSATGGQELWSELNPNVSVNSGFAEMILGDAVPLSINFNQSLWIEFTIADGTPLGRVALTCSPYSFYSHSSSGVFVGDSLVLKDTLGVTRFVINPNTGTLKMMNNDTVWYQLQVQSPPKSATVHSDGSYTVSYPDAVTGGFKIENFSAQGVLMKQELSETTPTGGKTTTKYFSEGQVVSMEESGGNMAEGAQFTNRYTYQNGEEQTRQMIKNYYYPTDATGVSVTETYYQGNIAQSDKKNIDGSTTVEFYNSAGDVVSKFIYGADGSTKRENAGGGSGFKSTLKSDKLVLGKYFDSPGTPEFCLGNRWDNNAFVAGYTTYNGADRSRVEFEYNNLQLYAGPGGSTNVQSNLGVTGNASVSGNANVTGNLNVTGTKNFRIDHPEDPLNKYLCHASIESNEVLNKYSGTATTGADGKVTVILPSYFESINKEFRYQLTVIGVFARAIISKKIQNNQFEIMTDVPNIEVCWEVTATRNDAAIRAGAFRESYDKEAEMRGKLLFDSETNK